MNLRARRIAVIALLLTATCGALFIFLQPRIATERHWQALQVRGVLRVGIDPGVRPFSFFGATGWEGYEADVAREIGRRLNLRIEAIPVGYDGFYDALTTDRVDVAMSALVPDVSRLNEFVFSDATIDVGVRLIGGTGVVYHEPNDLRNARVGVVLGSEADRTARWYERRVPGMQRVVVGNEKELMPQLRLGTFEWATADGVGVFAMGCPAISHRDGATHAPTTRCYSIQPLSYVVAASRANARPVGEINRVLNAMQADGTLDQLAAKWFVANAR